MKVWLDAQLPPSLCAEVGACLGADCGHVGDHGLLQADDAEVFATLRSAGNVILTKDSDFVDLVTRLGPPPQVLWLRVGNCTNAALLAYLQRALPLAVGPLNEGESVLELTRTSASA